MTEEKNHVRPWAILSALALGRIAFGYQFQTVATLGQRLIERFHLSYAAFGGLIGAYMLLGAFVALPLGILGRWLGDRLVTAVGFMLMVAGPVVCAWGGDPTGIAAGRVVAGIGGVGMLVLQGKIIADWFPGPKFLLAISIAVCGYPIGVDLAQLCLPPVAQALGWQSSMLTGSILPALCLLLFLLSYRASPYVIQRVEEFSLPSLRECLLLVIAGMIWTSYTAGIAGYLSYVPSTLSLRGGGVAVVGLVITIATWGQVPSTLFGGGLASRFGPLAVLVVGTLSLAAGTAATALLPVPMLWAALIGFLGSIQPGVIVAVGTLSARQEHRAIGMGIFYSLYYAGGTVGPALCGHAADLYGSPAGGLLAAAAIAALAIPLYLLHRSLAASVLTPAAVAED